MVATAKQKYTMVAAKAVSLAELFVAGFQQGLDGPVRFRVELSAPDGPSTGGGKQALQHIKLIPEGGGMAVVIGSADTVHGAAEIRTFEHIAALYAQRYHGAPIPVDPTRYQELTQRLAAFIRSMSLQVSFAALQGGAIRPPGQVGAAPAPSRGGLWMVVVAVVLGLVVVAGAYVAIFVRR
jgi:hypothetical protein